MALGEPARKGGSDEGDVAGMVLLLSSSLRQAILKDGERIVAVTPSRQRDRLSSAIRTECKSQ
jgi:hypothetical protein